MPVDPDGYEYQRAALDALRFHVQYLASIEPRRRLAPHLHAARTHVYVDPVGGPLVPAEDYLADNVRAKLATASGAAAGDNRFAPNVTALEAVLPAHAWDRVLEMTFGHSEFPACTGATWVLTS